MFTGMIEEIGHVERVTKGAKSSKLRIKAGVMLEGTRIGDSISTSGVCLTVTKLEGSSFEADVMEVTMGCSKLGKLTAGSRVNLERALELGGRFGGHMVSGHIDGIGIIQSIVQEENAVWLTIAAEEALLCYIVKKGSVAIDGVSLTVAAVDHTEFKVSVIPHTGRETTLLQQKVGDLVNLECDMIGKYVEKLLDRKSPEQGQLQYESDEPLSEAFLRGNGFY